MISFVKEYDFCKGIKGVKYVDNNLEFSSIPWFFRYDLDRKRITMINRVKSGHTRTKDHLFRKNILNSNECECGDVQTVEHLIWNCPRFLNYRDVLIQFLAGRGIFPGSDVTLLFNRSNLEVIRRVVLYVLLSGIIL